MTRTKSIRINHRMCSVISYEADQGRYVVYAERLDPWREVRNRRTSNAKTRTWGERFWLALEFVRELRLVSHQIWRVKRRG